MGHIAKLVVLALLKSPMKTTYASLVASSQIKNLILALKPLGVDVYALLKQANIPDSVELDDSVNNFIPLERIKTFLTAVQQNLGLDQQVQFLRQASYLNVQHMLSLCELDEKASVRQALETICSNIFKVSLDSSFRLQTTSSKTLFVRYRDWSSEPWFSLSDVYNAMAMTQIIRSIYKPKWEPKEIYLRAENVTLCRAAFDKQAQLFVGQPYTGVLIEEVELDKPITTALLPQQTKVVRQVSKTMKHTLMHALPLYFYEGRPSLEKAASIVGLHSRTLKRRLHAEGTTYGEVIEECIVEIAKYVLTHTQYKVVDISSLLGYQHATHFGRAFKKATGLTPKQYQASSRDKKGGA